MTWLKAYLLARLAEPSTWRGLIGVLAGLIGYDLAPELQAQLAVIAVALMGLVGVVTPDTLRRVPASEVASSAAPFPAASDPAPDRLRRDAPDGLSAPAAAPGAPEKPPDPWGWQRND